MYQMSEEELVQTAKEILEKYPLLYRLAKTLIS
jgi:hypothetical protein